MREGDLVGTAERAAVAELAYLDRAGKPRATALTPLVWGRDVGFALPYSQKDLAGELGASGAAAVCFSDSRLAWKGWRPMAARGAVDVFPDPRGELFTSRLLEQELAKFPPSRVLIDTFIMRKENWWYVPRLIVRFIMQGGSRPVARRSSPSHGVLAWAEADGLDVETVGVADWESEEVEVHSLNQRALPSAPACLFFHDFIVPERDRTSSLSLQGELRGDRLIVEGRYGSRDLARPPGLITRLRAAKDLEKRCKRALEEIGE